MNNNIRILGAGFSCIDIVKNGSEDKIYLGGTAANVLSVLGLLKCDVDFVLPNYSGSSGLWMNDALRNRNVKLKYFTETKKSAPQIIEHIDYHNAKHRFITICPKCKRKLNNIVLPTAKQVNKVLVDNDKSYSLFFYDRISEGIKQIIQNNLSTWKFYEPNSFRIYSTFLNCAQNANILKMSEERFPVSFERELLADLQETEVKLVIITLGNNGLKYSLRDDRGKLQKWVWLESKKIDKLVDSSGAGDWLSAVFIYEFLKEYPCLCNSIEESKVVDCLKKAQIVSEAVCGYEGAQGILCKAEGVEKISKVLEQKFDMVVDKPYQRKGECDVCLF